ncbi:MAG: hypothetical protein E6I27_08725 [Chloroflexi bacterium]|nr:MAG: hypothetical protein E6I27_08725 [Chloroflexota bacterium]
MGASAREIERQIKETRERMDSNLTQLEGRAATNAVRYGRIAAIGLGVLALAGVAFFIYRRTHRPTLRDRLDDLSVDNLRSLADELSVRLREKLPSVTVRVNEKTEHEPGTVEGILRKVAPALVGAAGSALIERVVSAPDSEFAAPQAE